MPSIDIEYPLADAQLGLSFQAGGTYELALRKDRPKKAAGPTYIRCKIYRQGATDAFAQSDDFDTTLDPSVWSVSFSLPPLPAGYYYTNCRIGAGFVSGGVYSEQTPAVDGVSAGPQGDPLVPQPGGTIIIVPPPQGP